MPVRTSPARCCSWTAAGWRRMAGLYRHYNMPIIRVENVHFAYAGEGKQEPVPALRGVDLSIDEGEYVAIVGHNGSGKSTLSKHLNALLAPSEGRVLVRDWPTNERAHLRDIRATGGMVFKVPDNQTVATIGEEDVGCGPETRGLP